MKKFATMAFAAALLCGLASCGKQVSYQGTPVEKDRYSFLKPEAWNQTADSPTRVFLRDDEGTNATLSIEAEEGKDYEQQISYYNEESSPWEAYEDLKGDGFDLKGFKKKDNEYYSFVAPLPDGKGQLMVLVGTASTTDNPMTHEIVKEVISTIKLK